MLKDRVVHTCRPCQFDEQGDDFLSFCTFVHFIDGRLLLPRRENLNHKSLDLKKIVCRGHGAEPSGSRYSLPMDWAPVFTVLATGFVTFGGVWLKGVYDLKAEKLRLDTQRRDAADERQRLQELEVRSTDLTERHERRTEGTRAKETFAEILEGLSKYNDAIGRENMTIHWNENFDARARLAVELISDADVRDDMLLIVNTLATFELYGMVNNLNSMGAWHVKNLVQTLLELAGSVARGEPVSPQLRGKVDSVRERDEAVDMFMSTQRE
jgi:hypothetical protein